MNQTTLWSSATNMRDQNNSNNGIRLAGAGVGSTMGLNPGPDSSGRYTVLLFNHAALNFSQG